MMGTLLATRTVPAPVVEMRPHATLSGLDDLFILHLDSVQVGAGILGVALILLCRKSIDGGKCEWRGEGWKCRCRFDEYMERLSERVGHEGTITALVHGFRL